MNYVTTTTGNIELNITTRANMAQGDTLNVTVDISNESNTTTTTYNGVVTMNSYYSTLSIVPNDTDIEFNDETFYLIEVKDLSDNEIYKGKLYSTTKETVNYKITENVYTTTTSGDNDFLTF